MTSRAEDARQWLVNKAGYHEADRLIRDEARQLRIDPTSETALRHALARYETETGNRYSRFLNPHHKDYQPPATQGELL